MTVFDSATSGRVCRDAGGQDAYLHPAERALCARLPERHDGQQPATTGWRSRPGETTTAYPRLRSGQVSATTYEWNGSAQTMTRYYGVYTEARVECGWQCATATAAARTGWCIFWATTWDRHHITADPLDGDKLSELRFKAWGETRYSSGTTPTKRQFTGQISDSYINLYWYGSRWYDDALGRFIQPDPIIPEPYNSLAYDRYQYVYSILSDIPIQVGIVSGIYVSLRELGLLN